MVIGYCSSRIHERDQTIGVRSELFRRIFYSGSGPQGASRLRPEGLIDSFSSPHSLHDLVGERYAFRIVLLAPDLNPSNKPGRVALVRRIVSLGPLGAFIAAHPCAELVERHGAQHRYSLAEHPERHPHGTLAALASDPGITLGFRLGDSSVVCHSRIKARPKRERTSFRPHSIPGERVA